MVGLPTAGLSSSVRCRNDNFDLYSIPATGGSETRLTTSAGYDDGPDFSPDGRWIYYNSDRSGSWDIWAFPPRVPAPMT